MADDVSESKALDEGASRALGAAFWFPNVVDNNVIRVNGSVIFLFALLVAIFYEDRQAHFAMGGLFIDFVLKVSSLFASTKASKLLQQHIADCNGMLCFSCYLCIMFVVAIVFCSSTSHVVLVSQLMQEI